jgi:hypothetical protein
MCMVKLVQNRWLLVQRLEQTTQREETINHQHVRGEYPASSSIPGKIARQRRYQLQLESGMATRDHLGPSEHKNKKKKHAMRDEKDRSSAPHQHGAQLIKHDEKSRKLGEGCVWNKHGQNFATSYEEYE